MTEASETPAATSAPTAADALPEDQDRRHAEKMAKKKAVRDKIVAGKTIEKGLLIVHTGKGKGKSTAAFGMVLRAIGHGFKVGVVQYVKGAWDTGERTVLERFPDQVTIKALGEGFTWETQDRARDIAAARAAWDATLEMLADPSYRMVLMDEINIVLRYGYLPVEEVVEGLSAVAACLSTLQLQAIVLQLRACVLPLCVSARTAERVTRVFDDASLEIGVDVADSGDARRRLRR